MPQRGGLVLIFGAGGLIGRGVLDGLVDEGVEVACFSRTAKDRRPGVRALQGDIADRQQVANAIAEVSPEVIVQLAARLQADCDSDPGAAVATNVDGMVNVLEGAVAHNVRRVVFGSSVAAYGLRSEYLREDDPPAAACSFYGETKRFGEILGGRYADLHGLEFIALRYSGVFGPGPVHGKGMALARAELKATASGQDVSLDYVSGAEVCHLTYLSDAVEATLAAIRHPAPSYRLYNIAGPQENHLSLRDFHAAVQSVVPAAGAANFSGSGRSGGLMDISRMRDDLGVAPKFTLLQGLKDEFSQEPSIRD